MTTESKSSKRGTGPGKSYRETIPLKNFYKRFHNDAVCEQWFIDVRWQNGVFCPRCGSFNVKEKPENPKYKSRRWYCPERDCKQNFTVKTNTIMHNSNLGFQDWLSTIFTFCKSLNCISSMELHNDAGITQKTAWHLGHRVRHAIYDIPEKFEGPVEVDEAYFGGKEKNRHWDKKRKQGSGTAGKDILVGLVDRKTKLAAVVLAPNTERETLRKIIDEYVEPGAKVFTDEHPSYKSLNDNFEHKSVKHGKKQYGRKDGEDNVNTNSIESFWANTKRAEYGVFRKISKKHRHRYGQELAGRQKLREFDTEEEMKEIIRQSFEKRLTWNELTKDIGLDNGLGYSRKKKAA